MFDHSLVICGGQALPSCRHRAVDRLLWCVLLYSCHGVPGVLFVVFVHTECAGVLQGCWFSVCAMITTLAVLAHQEATPDVYVTSVLMQFALRAACVRYAQGRVFGCDQETVACNSTVVPPRASCACTCACMRSCITWLGNMLNLPHHGAGLLTVTLPMFACGMISC